MPETALVRECDGCHAVTAFDFDVTEKNRREMQMEGQTVKEVPSEEARSLMLTACRCFCGFKKEASGRRCENCGGWKDRGNGWGPCTGPGRAWLISEPEEAVILVAKEFGCRFWKPGPGRRSRHEGIPS